MLLLCGGFCFWHTDGRCTVIQSNCAACFGISQTWSFMWLKRRWCWTVCAYIFRPQSRKCWERVEYVCGQLWRGPNSLILSLIWGLKQCKNMFLSNHLFLFLKLPFVKVMITSGYIVSCALNTEKLHWWQRGQVWEMHQVALESLFKVEVSGMSR